MNYMDVPTPKTLEDLFGALFDLPTTSSCQPPPSVPEKKVYEYIFAFANEGDIGNVQVTENFYTEEEFVKVADEVFATFYHPVPFTKREREREREHALN